jgi:hypothetical protein
MHPSVKEASGVVESRKNAGVLWVHNDSGDQAHLYAISTTGASKGTFKLEGAGAIDWEDMAVGPGPVAGQPYIYVGDIGDNAESRANVKIYRVPEPTVAGAPGTVTVTGVEHLTLQYPDGAHNAETLLVDPVSGDLFIVVKAASGVSPVFRAPAPLAFGGSMVMQKTVTLTFGAAPLSGGTTTTGGDISATGDSIAIRTYGSAFLWRRVAGATIAQALATEPCPIPLAAEGQGESLGFKVDGTGYYTLSEGTNVPLHFYARK